MDRLNNKDTEYSSKSEDDSNTSSEAIDPALSAVNACGMEHCSHSQTENSDSDISPTIATAINGNDPLPSSSGHNTAEFKDCIEDEQTSDEESFVDALSDLQVKDNSRRARHLVGTTDDECVGDASENSLKGEGGLLGSSSQATARKRSMNGDEREAHDQATAGEIDVEEEEADWRSRMEAEAKIHEDENTVNDEKLKAQEALLSDQEKLDRMKRCRELKDEGNDVYKQGNYHSAVNLYTEALTSCLVSEQRDRAVLYANRAAAKMCLEENEAAVEDCSRAVELDEDYVKARLRRAEIYERLDKLDEALADYQKILERDPSIHKARAACMRLPDQIQKRNEKLKAEMIDKLKDLGNLVLRPFGLSTENFKLQQDPNTGGYSVNFQK